MEGVCFIYSQVYSKNLPTFLLTDKSEQRLGDDEENQVAFTGKNETHNTRPVQLKDRPRIKCVVVVVKG